MPSKTRRLWNEKRAAAIGAKWPGKTGRCHRGGKNASQLSPLLYDLTSCRAERTAFGFSAKTTLRACPGALRKDTRLLPIRGPIRVHYPRTISAREEDA